jgi:hypothetical protein
MTHLPPTRRRRRASQPRRLALLSALTVLASSVLVTVAGTASAAPEYVKGVAPLSTPWTAEVGPGNALPEYPRPQLTRPKWQNLNGVWQFREGVFGEAPPSGQELGERILVPYPVESALSGIQRSVDRMWYRRTFEVPKDWNVASSPGKQRLWMHFGAVDYDATVYVNGRKATTHRGGYDKFDVDVTDLLTGRGPQEIVVGVEDLTDQTWQPVGKQRENSDRGIFYQGSSGIWQTVWMEPRAAASIDDLEMTPDLPSSTLELTAEVTGATAGQQVQAVARDRATGAVVGQVTGAANTQLSVPVPDAKLWSPDSPTLYDLSVSLLDRRKTVDTVGSYFGMRSIGIAPGADGRNRIVLNGEVLFNNSTLDQGFWPDGLNTAPTDAGLKFDLELHKRLGFNTVRKHIKVEPDRWYYHADTLGLLVWQDMPSMKLANGTPPVAAQQQFESELRQMVDEHDSWTSITTWVPMNEGWGEWDRTATGRIADEVKAWDPSRLVNAHSGVNCCFSKGDSGRGDMIDHHQYVGPATGATPDATRVAVDGEHGGLGLQTPGHQWFPDSANAYEMEPDSATLTRRYVEVAGDLKRLASTCALSASVYTQVTDVEAEVNGFVTYDRKVEKMDFAQVKAVNEEVTRSADGNGTTTPPTPGTPGTAGTHAYAFDEGAGTVATDSVGDADAALTGVGWAPRPTSTGTSTAGTFAGNGEAAPGAQLIDPQGSYSVSAWAKLDSLDGGFQTVVSQDTGAASAFFLQYSVADKRWAMSFVGARALSTATPVVGQWYHLTGVRDAQKGTLTLYVDGQQQGSTSACAANDAGGNTVIGRGQYDGRNVDYLRGAVDDVRTFDKALTPAEVAEVYTSGR